MLESHEPTCLLATRFPVSSKRGTCRFSVNRMAPSVSRDDQVTATKTLLPESIRRYPSLYPLHISAVSSGPQRHQSRPLFYPPRVLSTAQGPLSPSVNMLLLLFHLNFWSLVYSKTITGLTCPVTNSTGTQYTGVCVPLDKNDDSSGCNDVFGFLVLDVCQGQDGESAQNVFLLQI
jgi:hypothetical protein